MVDIRTHKQWTVYQALAIEFEQKLSSAYGSMTQNGLQLQTNATQMPNSKPSIPTPSATAQQDFAKLWEVDR